MASFSFSARQKDVVMARPATMTNMYRIILRTYSFRASLYFMLQHLYVSVAYSRMDKSRLSFLNAELNHNNVNELVRPPQRVSSASKEGLVACANNDGSSWPRYQEEIVAFKELSR